MKKFLKPDIKVITVHFDENIAASLSYGPCTLGRDYSSGKQECQKCKLYYSVKGSLPDGSTLPDGGIMTFCDLYGLGYSDKDSAINAANLMNCPEGKG